MSEDASTVTFYLLRCPNTPGAEKATGKKSTQETRGPLALWEQLWKVKSLCGGISCTLGETLWLCSVNSTGFWGPSLFVAISLLVFVVFAWHAVRHIKYVASFVLQCRFYCSQYAFKFEITLGTSFLLCLLENEIAHKTVEFANITRAASSADKSSWSCVFWPKEVTLLYSLDKAFRFMVRNQYFY